MDVFKTRRCHELKMFINRLGKGIDYQESGDKFGAGVSIFRKEVDTASTDENLFRLVLCSD